MNAMLLDNTIFPRMTAGFTTPHFSADLPVIHTTRLNQYNA